MIGNLYIKTKKFDFEECVLIGWLANTEIASQSRCVIQSSTFFPGQLAFCKKAVVGLAARRIF